MNIIRFTTLLLPFALFAQERASLTGTIFDASQSIVAGASIELRHAQTGLLRRVETSDAGIYRVGSLAVGKYALTVSRDGFQTKRINDITLQVGQTRTLDATLDLTQAAASVDVTADLVTLNQSSADVSKVVTDTELRKLPVNGRDWNAFLVLAPGAVNSGDGSQRSIRFLGRSKDDNNYTFDGIDTTAIKEGPQMVSLRTVISNDAVAEFKVNSSLYTAEYGFYMGGQVSFVSKGGTNEFHGSAFEFLRNDLFDARRFIDQSKPPFRLNQFGGSLGGPVIKNRTFFFANYEGLRQRLGQTQIGFVPNAAYRERIATTSPALRPLLDYYPRGQRAVNANIDEYTVAFSQRWDENSGMFRVDHRFNDKFSVYTRYNTANGEILGPLGIQNISQFNRTQTLATHNAVVQFQHIISPTTLNEFKLGLNRAANASISNSPIAEGLSITGLASLPGLSGGGDPGNNYTIADNFSQSLGRHTLKAGFEIRALQVNIYQFRSTSIAYPNLTAFQNNLVDAVNVNGEFGTRGVRSEVFMGYVQDEWKIKPNLTANIGVRYEFYMPLYEKYNRARIWSLECKGICPAGSDLYQPDYNNFDPRLSFAWSPQALKDRTTIRLGAGIYHQMGQLDDLLGPIESVNERINITGRDLPNLSYPVNSFLRGAAITSDTPRAVGFDRRDFYSYQYGLFIDQRLPWKVQGQVGYTATLGRKLMTRTYQNQNFSGTNIRPLPDFGIVDQKLSGNISNFHGLLASLNRRYSGGFLMGLQYMWSKAIDDGAPGSNEGTSAQNVLCRACERARGDFDVRHNINTSYAYELPFGKGKPFLSSGLASHILGGWEISGILTARTGRPITVTVTRTAAVLPDANNRARQRPNYVAGAALTPAEGQSASRWINFAAFSVPAPGTWGNLGRNVLSGPGLFQLDSSLTKRQRLTERVALTFRYELFNVTNRAQFAQPGSNISAGAEQFGRITGALNSGATGTGTSRQMQFMLRLDF